MGLVEGQDWVLHNTRLSAAALFDSLERYPKQIHVFDDIENVFSDKTALNMMRSALWGIADKKGLQARIVTYGVKNKLNPGVERRVAFSGQLLFTGNRPIEAIPELEALSTRIEVEHLNVSNEEILAVMKSICLKGIQTDKGFLPPKECSEVLRCYTQHLQADTMVNVRVLMRLVKLRLGTEVVGTPTDWHAFIARAICQSTESKHQPSRHQRIAKERAIALELEKQGLTGDALLAQWMKRTGHPSLDSYYRRRRGQ